MKLKILSLEPIINYNIKSNPFADKDTRIIGHKLKFKEITIANKRSPTPFDFFDTIRENGIDYINIFELIKVYKNFNINDFSKEDFKKYYINLNKVVAKYGLVNKRKLMNY